MSEAAATLPDPAPRLEAGFAEILRTRMAGLPFVHPRLAVEAVDFALWEGRWLGVMVTPWFVNLVLTPADPARWTAVPPGAKAAYRFPAGTYEFISARDELLGEYQSCALLSAPLAIADQDTARLIARCARENLFDPQHATEELGTPLAPQPTAEPGPSLDEKIDTKLEQTMSKRGFLRGAFLRGPDEPRG
jgi:[NiFe] hydrogenase assembly HybE family chaperone